MLKMFRSIAQRSVILGNIVPIQLIAVWALYTIFIGSAPSWWWVAVVIGYVCLTMLGISACYHRMLSHKAFQTNRAVKHILLWFAVIAGQGSPISWCVVHRGYHHRYTDRDGDVHSPRDGFWHSYILWMFKTRTDQMSIKSCVDLLQDKDCLFVHKHYQLIFWLSHITIALTSLDVWLYFVVLPAAIALHCFALQASLTHDRRYGYANYERGDDSRNVVWLFPLILGDAWHNNHHGNPRNANFGGRRWFELDPTFTLIKLISKNEPARALDKRELYR